MEQSVTTESENRILIEAVRIAAEQIESIKEELSMTRAQALIRKDMIEKLKSGPGGIMEMKQTIADREAELNECNLSFNAQVEENYLQSLDIERLEKYRNLVEFITSDYVELSYEKAQWQRDDWRKRCINLIIEDHTK
jgi:hypothetical protein